MQSGASDRTPVKAIWIFNLLFAHHKGHTSNAVRRWPERVWFPHGFMPFGSCHLILRRLTPFQAVSLLIAAFGEELISRCAWSRSPSISTSSTSKSAPTLAKYLRSFSMASRLNIFRRYWVTNRAVGNVKNQRAVWRFFLHWDYALCFFMHLACWFY